MACKIRISFDRKSLTNIGLGLHIRRCITQALRCLEVNAPCEINVLVTNNEGIRLINKAAREIDQPTDVLSFPAFSFEPGVLPEDWSRYQDPETGMVALGDMCISLERAIEQGNEFGHGIKREIGYLVVHSVLHLLGYDHETSPLDEAIMMEKQEAILETLGISRDSTFTENKETV